MEASSKHVLHDASGNLCLDRRGGYDKALVGFEIDSEPRQFLVDWPEISIVLERTNGTREPLMFGSAVILGLDDWNSSLVVRSPDRRATLTIAGRPLERPFANTGSWAIPLRQLYQAHDNHIYLLNGAARTLLARIETVAAPKELAVNHRADGVTARICAPFSIGGVLLVAEDEDGEVVSSEFSYDHFPTDMSADPKVSAKKSADDSVTILLKNSRSSEKLRLFDISLRELGRRTWNRRLGLGDGRAHGEATQSAETMPTSANGLTDIPLQIVYDSLPNIFAKHRIEGVSAISQRLRVIKQHV
jgi:hypothetical protein